MRRVSIPELLDTDSGSAEEVRASLQDLRRINHWFGGVYTSRTLLEAAMRQSRLRQASVLSVAAGDGWSICAAAKALAARGLQIQVTALDRSAAHLTAGPASRRVVADAIALPFADGAYDFVECSLFAHHLEPEQLKAFSVEALRVARQALLINDLRRERAGYYFAQLGRIFYRSPLTRHDAPASALRAYTIREMRNLLAVDSTARVAVWPSWFFRMGAIAWRKTGGGGE